MLIVLSRQICGRKGYPDSSSEQMDLWRKVTHMCIKKCSKGKATYLNLHFFAIYWIAWLLKKKPHVEIKKNGIYGTSTLI